MRAIVYGLAASFFFASSFILNRSMDLGGGYWAWSASLRFFFMVPLLLAVVLVRGGLGASLRHLASRWRIYLVWSTVGFGLFYAPLCFAASYGQGWLVAASWQVTIIAGPLLAPFLFPNARGSFSHVLSGLRWSALILLGVALMQWEHAGEVSARQALLCAGPVIFAAFMYPLGNRKMMAACESEVDTFQRVLNMTLASLPFWLLLALWTLASKGGPSAAQAGQSLLVALFSGVFATTLFFAATNLVRHDIRRLAAVEATQAGEILFALLGEVLLLSAKMPAPLSLAGMALVILGMVLHSLRSA